MQNEIVKYSKEWEKTYNDEAKKIKKALGKNCVAVHHIRDTSFKSDVCKVGGKIEIILLATVKKADDITPDTLRGIGYAQIFAGYKKDGETEVILWVREVKNQENYGEILRETSLRDYMASHPEKALEYTAHKAKCAEEANDILDIKEAMEKYFDELRPEISKWTTGQNNISMGLALGMCFGMSIGMAIGSSMGNTTLGMTMGMSLGMCLGIALGSAKNKK
jgi:GrpB-like predicted nucleotidyltransferase (UPF0157 family)